MMGFLEESQEWQVIVQGPLLSYYIVADSKFMATIRTYALILTSLLPVVIRAQKFGTLVKAMEPKYDSFWDIGYILPHSQASLSGSIWLGSLS